MSLERADLRIKMSADDHAMLALLAEAEELGLAELAEQILVRVVRRAMLIASKAQRLGIAGKPIPADE